MNLVARERLRLDQLVSQCCSGWTASDRAHVTIQQLLEHASVFEPAVADASAGVRGVVHPRDLRQPARSRARHCRYLLRSGIHSSRILPRADRGATASHHQSTELLSDVLSDVGAGNECDFLPASRRTCIAYGADITAARGCTPSSPSAGRRARQLRSGAWRLCRTCGALRHGVRGRRYRTHGSGCGAWGRASRAVHARTVAQMLTPSRVPGSSRALGWDTMRPTSSCGRFLSPSSVGHVGFTGTSVWIDPERDRYVLLTNRVRRRILRRHAACARVPRTAHGSVATRERERRKAQATVEGASARRASRRTDGLWSVRPRPPVFGPPGG